jgi:hypothetical protein
MPALTLQPCTLRMTRMTGVKIQEPLDRAIDTSSLRVELGDRRPTPQEAAR